MAIQFKHDSELALVKLKKLTSIDVESYKDIYKCNEVLLDISNNIGNTLIECFVSNDDFLSYYESLPVEFKKWQDILMTTMYTYEYKLVALKEIIENIKTVVNILIKKASQMEGNVTNISMQTQEIVEKLNIQIEKIESEMSKNYLKEALETFKLKHYRSSVVLSWEGAIHILHEYIFYNKLNQYTTQAKNKNPKFKDITCPEDFSRNKEKFFIEVLSEACIVTPDIAKQFLSCLETRNSAGHPNDLVFTENRVATHLEFLIEYVYSKYSK